jgi:hypothetical protein
MGGACVLHCKVCRASDAGIKKDANLHDCFQATSRKFARKLGCGFEAKGDSKDSKK